LNISHRQIKNIESKTAESSNFCCGGLSRANVLIDMAAADAMLKRRADKPP
jgi:hypothetical protein